ncbi:UNVERIFIED_ORG: helix-turn-helix protein [Providencia alcalifaciens]
MNYKGEANFKIAFSRKIGLKIKNLRILYKVSGKDLAEVVAISQQQLSRYENGFGDISVSKIYLIALYFSVDINYFFD